MAIYTQTAAPIHIPLEDSYRDVIEPCDVHEEVLRLFDASAPALRRYVRSCGVPTEQCEDIVQDAFVALFRHLRNGGARHNLRGWLVQVSYRMALKQRQRLTRRRRVEAPWVAEAADLAIDPADPPDARFVANRHRHRLRSVFEALPERQQRCLALRAEGFRYRDIAKALGISLGAVAKAITLGVTRLTNAVKD